MANKMMCECGHFKESHYSETGVCFRVDCDCKKYSPVLADKFAGQGEEDMRDRILYRVRNSCFSRDQLISIHDFMDGM